MGAMPAATPARVTRIEEGRATYRTADGQEKEAYAKLYLSLISRLYGSNAAEWGVAMHVLEMTRFDGLPKRISIRQFADVCHLSNPAIQDGIARLVERGILYEEREAAQNIRYALIDAANPDTLPYAQEDGTLAIILLGGLLYQVPEGVSFFCTVRFSAKCIKKLYGTVQKSYTPRIKKTYSAVSESYTVPSRQTRQGKAAPAPRDSLESITERREDSVTAGAGAPTPQNLSDSHSSQPEPPPTTLFPEEPSSMPKAAPGELPPRQAGETDRDYWLRITQNVDAQLQLRRVVECAHRKIGVPRESASYARMGTLLKRHKVAFIIRRILNLSGEVIDDDPMSYLTKVLSNQQRREQEQMGVDLRQVPGFAGELRTPQRFVTQPAFEPGT